MRLALLHSSLLLLGAVPNLAQELGRLLHLLAAGLRNLHGDAPGGPPTGPQATLIGSQGAMEAGTLVHGMEAEPTLSFVSLHFSDHDSTLHSSRRRDYKGPEPPQCRCCLEVRRACLAGNTPLAPCGSEPCFEGNHRRIYAPARAGNSSSHVHVSSRIALGGSGILCTPRHCWLCLPQLQVDGPQILQAVQQAVEKEHSQR